jgi:pimeloyl-ACP methyl ester carboxylesterase
MKRGLVLVVSLAIFLVAAGAAVYAGSFALIRHEDLNLYDASRARPVDVDLYINRFAEAKARAGLRTLPVAIVNHGYTVGHGEYTFITNILAARGYLVASIQHDLPSDPPLSMKGAPYVGRLPMYERAMDNIAFTIAELKKIEPNADYDHLTMVGHSNGGDISLYSAGLNPDRVAKVVTLDNLRVPFLMAGKQKILSFRSRDWKPDPGVVPNDDLCKDAGIQLVRTDAQHVDMSDRGPPSVKAAIQTTISRFLDSLDESSADVYAKTEKKKRRWAGFTAPSTP